MFQSRFANWSCSFELAPAPSFVIAVFLSGSKPALAVSSVAQHAEAHAQHGVIGRHGLLPVRGVEPERDRAVGVRLHRAQPPAHAYCRSALRLHDRVAHRDREQGVAADDVESLVGLAVERERSAGVAEQVDEVERGLLGRLGSVLDVVGDVEQLAERRRVAARHAGLDPLVDAHVVEGDPLGRRDLVGRRIARHGQVAVQRRPDRLEVAIGLVGGVVVAEEAVRVGRAVRLGAEQVDGRQVEPPGEREDRLVPRVDQLAAQLGSLAVGPVAGKVDEVGVHAAADPRRMGFVDRGADSAVLQRESRRQARDAAADDRNSRRGRAPRAAHERAGGTGRGQCGADGSGPLEEVLARVRLLLAAGSQLLDRDPKLLGRVVLAGQLAQRAQQRCACHRPLPPAVSTRSFSQRPRSGQALATRRKNRSCPSRAAAASGRRAIAAMNDAATQAA